MDKKIAEEIFFACERAIAELDNIESSIIEISDKVERSEILRGLGRIVGELCMSLRGPIVAQYPELEPKPELEEPDTVLDAESLVIASGLSDEEVRQIDEVLLTECASSWRKVARVVGGAMGSLSAKFKLLPDGYYAQRVIKLVDTGRLESQGNLNFIGYSEVRLPKR